MALAARELGARGSAHRVLGASRCSIAIPSALLVNAAVGLWLIDQPTTRRLNASSTTAQYTFPSRVGCSVMSVTHNWLGRSRMNIRSTRSSAEAALGIP